MALLLEAVDLILQHIPLLMQMLPSTCLGPLCCHLLPTTAGWFSCLFVSSLLKSTNANLIEALANDKSQTCPLYKNIIEASIARGPIVKQETLFQMCHGHSGLYVQKGGLGQKSRTQTDLGILINEAVNFPLMSANAYDAEQGYHFKPRAGVDKAVRVCC